MAEVRLPIRKEQETHEDVSKLTADQQPSIKREFDAACSTTNDETINPTDRLEHNPKIQLPHDDEISANQIGEFGSVLTGNQIKDSSRTQFVTLRGPKKKAGSIVSGSRLSNNARSSVAGSIRSLRSGSSARSIASSVSNSQVAELFQAKKTLHKKKAEVEKQHLRNRLEKERQCLEETMRREEEELLTEERERKRMLDEEERVRMQEERERANKAKQATLKRLEDIKRKHEMSRRSLEQRLQHNLQEITDRTEREDIEIDADFTEIMIERGMNPTINIGQNSTQAEGRINYDRVRDDLNQFVSPYDFTVNQPEPGMLASTRPFGNSVQVHQSESGVNVVSARGNPDARSHAPVNVRSVYRPNVTYDMSPMAADYASPAERAIPINGDYQRAHLDPNDKLMPLDHSALGEATAINDDGSDSLITPNEFSQLPSNPAFTPQRGTLQNLLPPFEPPVFTGEPSEFSNFIDIFETAIGSKIKNQKQKLVYLTQYTGGSARDLVKGCLHLDANECYSEALKLLRETYGQRFQIGESCLSTLTDGPQMRIHDREGLTSFSAKLISCVNTFKGIKYTSIPLKTIDAIADRMPYQWSSGWLTLTDKVLNEKCSEVTLHDLSGYVRRKVREVTNHPRAKPNNTGPKPVTVKPSKSNFATKVGHSKPTSNASQCIKCKGSHFLNQCSEFRALSVESRWEYVRRHKLCSSCLEPGHWANDCNREKPCRYENCDKRHTTLLHVETEKIAKTENGGIGSEANKGGTTKPGISTKVNAFVRLNEDRVLLDVMPVRIRVSGTDKYIITNAFFDTGSHCSFISDGLINKLDITGSQAEFNLRTMHGESGYKGVAVTNLELSDFDGSEYSPLTPLFSTKEIGVENSDIPSQKDARQFPEFREVYIPEVKADVGLLIGRDNRSLHKPLKILHGPNDYYAILTKAGWMINCPSRGNKPNMCSFFTKAAPCDPLSICRMCHDFMDSHRNDKTELSPNQKAFLKSAEESIRLREDGHYEMKLPLADAQRKFANNRSQAEQRMVPLAKRFKRDPSYHDEYREFMKEIIANSHAEKVIDTPGTVDRTWFLCHHGVYHPEKKKIRVVFDCSAKYDGVSLNDTLLQGPDLTNNLVGVLTRFRKNTVAIQGDIRAMFHQVKVRKNDRDLLRFLWWKDGDPKKPLEEYRMTVFPFGTVCSPSCANYALRKTAQDNENAVNTDATRAIHESFYVDDFLDCKPDAESAINHAKAVRSIAAKGGFQITKMVSNDRSVLSSIPECDRAADVKGLDLSIDELPVERALGLVWNVEKDTLGFKIKNKVKPHTRRGILSVLSSTFDPLMIIQPVILPMKILLQTLCRSKLGWDDPVPLKCQQTWLKWLSELPTLANFNIPRCFVPANFGEVTKYELHHFSDASEKAYGAVSYIRSINRSGNIHCAILCGKSRLVPLRGSTIPRLELSAATQSIHSDIFFRKELKLPIDDSFFWTDSTIVLRYIANSEKAFKTFVANRVNQIKDGSTLEQWRYVPSKLNPADIASRGISAESLVTYPAWKQGPEYLRMTSSMWPEQPEFLQTGDVSDLEIKTNKNSFSTVVSDADLVDRAVSRCSTWNKLKRVIAWVLRFKLNCLKRAKAVIRSRTPQRKDVPPLTVEELNGAELILIRHQQAKYYPSELERLSKGSGISRVSTLQKLHPILAEGVLRVGGRISSAPVCYDTKHPLLIPTRSPIAALLLREIHVSTGHSGREYVLSELRQKYWIPRSSTLIRKILGDCVSCRRRQRPSQSQLMADLPIDRLTPDEPPFTFVGCDCFGPFLTRRGRTNVKTYGAVFTCMTTRAVHIETLSSMDTSSFINALRRFVARRGQVREIRSDNGTNLTATNKELRDGVKSWNQTQISNSLSQKNVTWTFQTPTASHHGGVYERQIRTLRKILHAICEEQRLTHESLSTLLCECEAIINGRPISTTSNDPSDMNPITPNSLLLLKERPVLPPGIFNPEDAYSRRRWRQVQFLADLFWKRWRKEYLPLLQCRQKWTKSLPNVNIGDVVLVVDDKLPRNHWLMGLVTETYPDKYGLVRSVSVRTKSQTYKRPVTKVILLLTGKQ